MSRAEPLTVEPNGSNDLPPCQCCGNPTRRVWGYAYRGDRAVAAYFVEWVPFKVPEHGATFDLIIGTWGEGVSSRNRVAVSLAFRRTPDGPRFMVVDAGDRPTAQSDLVGEALRRTQVLDTPTADTAFAIVDAIWLGDSRIAELADPSA